MLSPQALWMLYSSGVYTGLDWSLGFKGLYSLCTFIFLSSAPSIDSNEGFNIFNLSLLLPQTEEDYIPYPSVHEVANLFVFLYVNMNVFSCCTGCKIRFCGLAGIGAYWFFTTDSAAPVRGLLDWRDQSWFRLLLLTRGTAPLPSFTGQTRDQQHSQDLQETLPGQG